MEGTRAETCSVSRIFSTIRATVNCLAERASRRDQSASKTLPLLFDGIGTVEAYIFNMAGKIDMDIAQKHALFTPETEEDGRTAYATNHR